jgi:FkbM family methyltransferase
MIPHILRCAGRKVHGRIRSLVARWNNFCPPSEQSLMQSAALRGLNEQVEKIAARLQTLDRDLTRTVTAEIDRLDSYLVYHAIALGRQIDRRSEEIGDTAPLYVQNSLDALLIAAEFDLLVPTCEVSLLSYLTRHGLALIEPGVQAILRDRLVAGATAVDIGANVGLHALKMAKIIGPDGRLICLEPLPDIASTLERTLRLNGFGDRSQVICSAAADTCGEAKLHRASHSPLSSLFPISEESALINVKTTTLDDCFAPGEQVDMIKIDVQGAEPLVYRGMQRILNDNPGVELILKWSASHFVRSDESPGSFWLSIRHDGFKTLLIDNEHPSQLVEIQEPATIPGAANLLLTRKWSGSAGITG